jgi:hypothetical protein
MTEYDPEIVMTESDPEKVPMMECDPEIVPVTECDPEIVPMTECDPEIFHIVCYVKMWSRNIPDDEVYDP